MTKIEQKIASWSVVKADEPATVAVPDVQQMHESVVRPEVLQGTTYKIKTPLSEHALYVTINDILLNGGTQHETRRPFEIFINSKAMEHFQWIVALTRIISAVFRKGGDCAFLVEEMRSVFDPKGGYFKKGGKYMPSLVAEIGDAIEAHLLSIGMIEVDDSLAVAARAMLSDKADKKPDALKAQICPKCGEAALVKMDGCLTCTSCGSSACC